jgi:hypothetical protein
MFRARAPAMMRRSLAPPSILVTLVTLAALATLSPALLACGGGAAETVSGGQVSQYVGYRRYDVQPRLDVVVVVSTSAANGGAALRTTLATAVRDRMRELAGGEHWLRDVWNPLDVRAFVASAADGSLRSPATDAALAWREANATTAGADAFAAAVEVAIRAAPEGEAPSGGVVETLRRTLGTTATEPPASRLVVLVSTADDPGALPARDAALRPDGDSLLLVLPSVSDDTACSPIDAPSLTRWGKSNDALVETPCSGLGLQTSFVDYASDCLPRELRRSTSAAEACRVRAFVPRGTPCDPARGWRSPKAPSTPTLDPALEGLDACEVVALEGADAASCLAVGDRFTGTASGWCVPAPTRACSSSPPRIVGGAAPPFALVQVACELAP